MVKISVNTSISVSLSLFCIIISFIILLSGLFDSGRGMQTRRLQMSRVFRLFILSNIGFMITDVLTKIFGGHMEWYRFFIARISIFSHFIFGSLLLASMTMYMISYISIEEKVSRKMSALVYSICGLSLLLIVVSQFNNMYYYFDENNIYRRGPLWLVSQIIPLIALFTNLIIIILYRRTMQSRAMLFLIMYLVLPASAIFLHTRTSGMTFTSLGTTLAILVFYITVQSEVFRSSEAKIKRIEQALDLQREYYIMLQSRVNEAKAARHDQRHHLTLIQSYINADDIHRLKAYLNEYVCSLPVDDEIMFCKNFAVNSILRYYIAIANNEGIRVETRLDLEENIGISDSDLCIIFGNCVENAIEACQELTDGKFIEINAKPVGKMLVITIDNSFNGNIKKSGDTFWSFKRDSEGIGISSVKAVTQKYGETAQFEAENNVFKVSILLHVK